METAAPSNEEPINASTGVSFAVDVKSGDDEEGLNRRSSAEEMKHRASLSASAKQWDLDGDGELDEAELALKELDGSRKGTLSKAQMYKLMTENLQTQRELFKVKKVVAGLLAFTCLLALSNLGTSLAAAFLAKDTKSSDDKLTDSKSDRTLATQTAREVLMIDQDYDEMFSRRRMQQCSLTNLGGGDKRYDCSYASLIGIPQSQGEEIVSRCQAGNAVTVTRTFTFYDDNSGDQVATGTVAHALCPLPAGTDFEIPANSPQLGNSPNAPYRDLLVPHTLQAANAPKVGFTSDGSEYTITNLLSDLGEYCSEDSECVAGSRCIAQLDQTKRCVCSLGSTLPCPSGLSCFDPIYCNPDSGRFCTTQQLHDDLTQAECSGDGGGIIAH